jgi:hypothetical protein
MTAVAPILQAFFTDRLITQRRASPHTIAGYRDTFRLLIGFAATKTGKKPFVLDIGDLDAPTITAFLNHLEHDRGNQPRTRNWRLAAIHSLFSYAALHHPEHAATIHRVLAIPPKRYQRNVVNWLTEALRRIGAARRCCGVDVVAVLWVRLSWPECRFQGRPANHGRRALELQNACIHRNEEVDPGTPVARAPGRMIALRDVDRASASLPSADSHV